MMPLIKNALRERNMSQRDLAVALGISPGRVSQIMVSEKVSAERALELQRVLGIPLHEMRADIWPKPPNGVSA